jgi:CheY-like chemotaxis protein
MKESENTTGPVVTQSVLLVEDNALLGRVCQRQLQEVGVKEITWVKNAEDAISEMRRRDYDAVLMDIHVEGTMDGVEAAQHILAVKPKACIIPASADFTVEMKKRCESVGMRGFLSKPFTKFNLAAELSCNANPPLQQQQQQLQQPVLPYMTRNQAKRLQTKNMYGTP